MLNKKVEDAFNKHMNEEFYSAYLYLSMCSYFETLSLTGMASWMKFQAQEELFHALKFFDYVNERGGHAILHKIKEPEIEWASPLEAFKGSCEHESYITGCINNLVNLCIEEKDHASNAFLQWFVTEQVEEEASVGEIYDKLKLVGADSNGLFMIDKELSSRPAPTMPQE